MHFCTPGRFCSARTLHSPSPNGRTVGDQTAGRSDGPSPNGPSPNGPSPNDATPFATPAFLIDDDPNHLHANPSGIQLMAQALAEVIVHETAAFVVEADPQAGALLGQGNLERLAGRDALVGDALLALEENRVGVLRIARQAELGGVDGHFAVRPCRSGDDAARLIAAAAVDEPARPDPRLVPLADAAVRPEHDLVPALLAHDAFELILRHVMGQRAAL